MSKILKMKLDWMEDWNNNPRLKVLIDKEPVQQYDERSGLYLSIDGDIANYIYWNGQGNTGGFGGRAFDVQMKDGTVRKLLGPWSSRAECACELYPETPIIEAEYTTSGSTFNEGSMFNGGYFVHGAATIESLKGKAITLLKGRRSEVMQDKAYIALLSNGSYEFVVQETFGPAPKWFTKDHWLASRRPDGWKEFSQLPEVAVVFK